MSDLIREFIAKSGVNTEGLVLKEAIKHPALEKPVDVVLNAIIRLRRVIGNEYKSMSYSGTVPEYLKKDDADLEKIYKKIDKMADSYRK